MPVDRSVDSTRSKTPGTRAAPASAREYLSSAMLGYNPFGEQQQVVSKLTSAVFAAADGEYTFAASVDDVGARSTSMVNRSSSPASVPVMHVSAGKPNSRARPARPALLSRRLMAVTRDSRSLGNHRPRKISHSSTAELNPAFGATEGPLEQQKKTLVADFAVQPISESWVADNYSQRYKFKGQTPQGVSAKFDWDFGDGQLPAARASSTSTSPTGSTRSA